MSDELFTDEAYPNGLRCWGCGHDFEEFEEIHERPASHPDVVAVAEMVTGRTVEIIVELVCEECAP
jgi:hypothetical protein